MKTSEKTALILSLLWAGLVLALGIWWLYLLILLNKSGPSTSIDIASLVKWEGGAFLLMLLLISGTLCYQYLKNEKRGRALRTFFASMTHELKTPLASIRLQAEVLAEKLEALKRSELANPARRLIEDTQKLETQMDKILQLSRIEGGGNLVCEPLSPVEFVKKCQQRWGQGLELEWAGASALTDGDRILADEFALELIFRNLFENTKVHTPNSKVKLSLSQSGRQFAMDYSDGGIFKGDPKKIGGLFYKHKSRGSGIGLYLTKRLLTLMGGDLAVAVSPSRAISFRLRLPLASQGVA